MLNIACLRNHRELASYCLDAGASMGDDNPFDIVDSIIYGNSFDVHRLLVSRGLDINRSVKFSDDVLINAVHRNNVAWVRYCLEAGADPNQGIMAYTRSPIALAAESASLEVATLLLRYNAKLKGSGALILVSQEGRLDMVKFLLEKGADIDEIGVVDRSERSRRRNGGSAMHLIKKGQEDILSILLENGANFNLNDCKGRTPLERFFLNEDTRLFEALKMADASWSSAYSGKRSERLK